MLNIEKCIYNVFFLVTENELLQQLSIRGSGVGRQP